MNMNVLLRKAALAESHMCNEDQPTTKPPLNSTSLELRPEGKHEKKDRKSSASHKRCESFRLLPQKCFHSASPEGGRPAGASTCREGLLLLEIY